MTYQDCLDFLYQQLPIFQRQGKAAFNKDLGKTIALCQAIGNPQKSLKFIHVAGTNGKGSVCHMAASLFMAAGHKTGLYTSPHLTDFRERIQVNGQYIEKSFVVKFIEKHQELIQEIRPSFFELTVALAFDYFKHTNCDIILLEVGMGGRLDSTNIISPILSVITRIGFDHMQFLGNTLEAIASEKAGIIKSKTPVIIGRNEGSVWPVFLEKAQLEKAELIKAEHSIKSIQLIGQQLTKLEFDSESFLSFSPSLAGDYQLENIETVAAIYNKLKTQFSLRSEHFKRAVSQLNDFFPLKGRWQKIADTPTIVADVAHNSDGLKNVRNQLAKAHYSRLHIVFGMVNDKGTDHIKLLPKNAHYYLCQANIPRALAVQELKEIFTSQKFDVKSSFESVTSSIQLATQKADEDDFILITGSLFVVAEALSFFED